MTKPFSIVKFNIAEELEKFSTGQKTRVETATLLHLAADSYLENCRGARKRVIRIRRAQRSRVGNVIQFPRLA